MIDVTALMVGDYLIGDEGMVKVISIAMDGVYFEDKVGEGACSLDRLSPIRITPSILEKNGWFLKNGYWTKKGPVRLSWKEDGTLIVGYFQFPCAVEFVHTLQNILRLLDLEDIQI